MWSHRKGWRSYDFKVNQKIEAAYLQGEPSVELVNPFNKNALQIDFLSMSQTDLKSQNSRPVRRQEFTLINENGSDQDGLFANKAKTEARPEDNPNFWV